jgi:DNA-directed RNA polymerase specialized sigma24 family protein
MTKREIVWGLCESGYNFDEIRDITKINTGTISSYISGFRNKCYYKYEKAKKKLS